MHQRQDHAHIQAMSEMAKLMKNPSDVKKWFESKRKEFEVLPQS